MNTALTDTSSEPALDKFSLIGQTLVEQANAGGVKYIAVHGAGGQDGMDCLLSLDEAFAADGLLPVLVSMVQQRPGFDLSPLYLLPDSTNTLAGWRVEMEQAVTDEQMRAVLELLTEELGTLITASEDKEIISLDSQMWQRLLQRDEGATGGMAVTNESVGLA